MPATDHQGLLRAGAHRAEGGFEQEGVGLLHPVLVGRRVTVDVGSEPGGVEARPDVDMDVTDDRDPDAGGAGPSEQFKGIVGELNGGENPHQRMGVRRVAVRSGASRT